MLLKIREMDIVGRGLAGIRDKENPMMKLTLKNIRQNLFRKRKYSPISVVMELDYSLPKTTKVTARFLKSVSNTLNKEEFKQLNGIIGRKNRKDVMFVNKDHHIGFPVQLNEGHLLLIPYVNKLNIKQINEKLKKGLNYLKKNEKQWMHVIDFDVLQKNNEKYFPSFAITDWKSINVDGGFLPLINGSSCPLQIGYSQKKIFCIFDHLWFSGAIIGKFLNSLKDEIQKVFSSSIE